MAKAERFMGIDHLYKAENGPLVNHLIQALKAESLYKRDVDYAVVDGEVKIIDEFTGRILDGRRWSEGLHQAVEAKEGVRVQEENQTLATITLQNYFRMYKKLAGMTGTALTEATEFMKIYKLPVVQIPTNRPMVRDGPERPGLQDQGRQVGGRGAGDLRAPRGGPARAGRDDLRRGLRAAVRAAQQARDPAHRPERQAGARRARGRDHRRGRPPRRRDDRHQHGRPRRRHQARRQPRAPHAARARQARPAPGRPRLRGALRGRAALDRGARRGGPREGHGGRRPVHLRHGAPRVAPDRQPAARPRRPPGRPRRVALLPLRRGRARPPLRRRPHLPHPRSPRPRHRRGRGGADRGEDALEADRERPAQGGGAELPHPQARPRVRRRDEPAARDRLPVPRPRAGGPGHGRHGARADRRGASSASSPSTRRATTSRSGISTGCGRSSTRSSTSTSSPDELDRESIDRTQLDEPHRRGRA